MEGVLGGGEVVTVDVPGTGDEAGGLERGGGEDAFGGACEVRVFGGAAVHLVHTVDVEVITVVEIVAVVWVNVTVPEVDVKVTGQVVKVV